MKKFLFIALLSVAWGRSSAQVQLPTGGPQAVVIIDTDELGVSVSPNPASYSITINARGINITNNLLIMHNNFGLVVLSLQLTSPVVDVSGLPNGTYYFDVLTDLLQLQCSGSFIVQH